MSTYGEGRGVTLDTILYPTDKMTTEFDSRGRRLGELRLRRGKYPAAIPPSSFFGGSSDLPGLPLVPAYAYQVKAILHAEFEKHGTPVRFKTIKSHMNPPASSMNPDAWKGMNTQRGLRFLAKWGFARRDEITGGWVDLDTPVYDLELLSEKVRSFAAAVLRMLSPNPLSGTREAMETKPLGRFLSTSDQVDGMLRTLGQDIGGDLRRFHAGIWHEAVRLGIVREGERSDPFRSARRLAQYVAQGYLEPEYDALSEVYPSVRGTRLKEAVIASWKNIDRDYTPTNWGALARSIACDCQNPGPTNAGRFRRLRAARKVCGMVHVRSQPTPKDYDRRESTEFSEALAYLIGWDQVS
jgi:hypothetical protein